MLTFLGADRLDEAKELVRRQAVHGILYFPADFDTKLNRGEQAHVGVYCDMSLMLTYKAIYQTSQAVASHINSGIQITQAGGFTDRDDEITTEPLAFDEVPIFNTKECKEGGNREWWSTLPYLQN